MEQQKPYEMQELLVGVMFLIFMFVFGIGIASYAGNANQYIGKQYIKIEMPNYETPYDLLSVRCNNTVTFYYQNELATVPYQEINNETFSFVLPTDNSKYTVKIINDPTIDANNKILISKNIALITNEAGFKQAMIKVTRKNELTENNYIEVLNSVQ